MSDLILLVDDDAGLRSLLRKMLEMGGYEVVEAADGVEALAALERRLPAIVILDVMMPNMDGITFCKKVRAEERWAGLPIVILSGKTQQWAIDEGLAAGANEYLCKPIAFGDLLQKVRTVLANTSADR